MMKKGLFLLAFLAFTFSVKAEGTGGYTSDIVIAEGENISLSPVLVAQNTLRNDGWFENCASGTEIRVYVDYLPNDDSITLNTKVLDVKDANTTPWTYKTTGEPETHSSLEWFYLCQQSEWDTALLGGTDNYDKFIQYETSQDTLSGNEYVAEDELSRVSALEVSNTYIANDSASVQGGRARAYNRALINNAVMLPNAGVMINNLHITITNSVGQVVGGSDTNLFITLTNLVDIVQGIQDELGFTNSGDTLKSLLDRFMTVQLTGWNAIWSQLQDIRDYTSNLTNTVDYTGYFNLLESFGGFTNNTTAFLDLMRNRFIGPTSSLGSLVGKGGNRRLLFGDFYDLINDKYISIRNHQTYNETEDLMTDLEKWNVLRYYNDTAWELRRSSFETNVVDGVSLGRDWLNLATNDISSLPYWLNQQDFSSAPPIGVTNWQAQTRWTVLTNQYAQIGLTGSGQQANSTETWNYFKRLEMLLAALVYKPDDEGEKLSNDMNSQSTDAESKKQDVANSLDGLLSSFGGQKTLLQGQTSSFLSALGRVNEMFDQTWTPGQWRYWKDGAEDSGSSSGGSSGSSVELWIDFSDSKYQFIFDFIRSLCGFVWSFFSLLIIYKFAIFAYKLGMKFARVAYSILRHMFGQ